MLTTVRVLDAQEYENQTCYQQKQKEEHHRDKTALVETFLHIVFIIA